MDSHRCAKRGHLFEKDELSSITDIIQIKFKTKGTTKTIAYTRLFNTESEMAKK